MVCTGTGMYFLLFFMVRTGAGISPAGCPALSAKISQLGASLSVAAFECHSARRDG